MARQGDSAVRVVIERILRDVERYDASHDPQLLDPLLFEIDMLMRHVLAQGAGNNILLLISQARSAVSNILDISAQLTSQPNPNVIYSNRRGRPRLGISEQQLLHLLSLRFNCPTIASMLGVSLRTVRRRMSQYNLSVSSLYSEISDNDLDRAVTALKEEHPNSGYRIMNGLLLQQGIRVKQMRIRESMHRVDPHGVIVRWQQCIKRRQYNVTGPLALWHIDGNHKLIRYINCHNVTRFSITRHSAGIFFLS